MLIAISMSWRCIQEPRCSFCYLANEGIEQRVLNKLAGERDSWGFWGVRDALARLQLKSSPVLCFEYNGWNIDWIEDVLHYCDEPKPSEVTMTTMPKAVTPIFCPFVFKRGVSAIALSYDSEKVSCPGDWLEKARMIKDAGMQVSCNYLIEPHIGLKVPEEILRFADQLNLLSMKPPGKMSAEAIKVIAEMIQVYRAYLPVATDNCLGYQLGFTDRCHAGEEFIHIMPDGQIKKCCFEDKCFLWKGRR